MTEKNVNWTINISRTVRHSFENMLLPLARTDGWAFTELTVPINSGVHDK